KSPLKLDTSNSMQILESVGEDPKCEQLNFVVEGEITSPHVPDPATPKSNVKRMSLDGSIDYAVNHIAEGDLSSTKVKKVIKRGKKTVV
ncbi:hypothetical protein RYX36_004668, partial [Vicia faba]